MIYLIIFLLGLIIGSFLNCLIYRLEVRQSPLSGRSYCPRCKRKLGWQDLIPVLSFLSLKGKCRYCHQKISWQYPLVEISTALIFLLIYNFQFLPTRLALQGEADKQFLYICFLFLISCFLIVIFVYDLRYYIIPDEIIYPAIVIAFIYRLLEFWNFGHWNLFGNWKLEIGILQPLLNPLISAFLASAFFLLILLISRGKWMGIGDIKLAFFMGLFLGFPNILIALFSAFFIGAIMGIGLIIAKRKTLKSEVPFGPFLITGTMIALFFGGQIANWYLNFLGNPFF